jgi:RNA polymerase sigma factor (sigma-70 family)
MRVRGVDVISWSPTTEGPVQLPVHEYRGVDVIGVAPGPSAGRAGFEAFYRREYGAVVAFAYALCGRGAAAEDLAQEAFLATFRHWAKVGDYDRPEAYVRHVVANMATSSGRRRRAEGRAMVGLAGRSRSSVDNLEPPDAAFWRKVRQLPTRQAQSVALYYLEDRSAEEIAEILHCSESTVRVHLHRGRLTLEEQLREGSQE